MARRASLRRRLLIWLLPSGIGLSFVWLWGAYSIVIHFADLTYDRALEDTVETIAEQVQVHGNRPAVDLPPAARRMLEFDRTDRVYYMIIDERRRTFVGNMALASPRGGRSNAHGNVFYDGMVEGRSVRIVQRTIGEGAKRRLSVRVAETRAERSILTREVMTYMIALQLLLLASLILLIWVGVGRGVAPLARVRDAIARLDPKSLHRIEENDLPAELEEQVGVINHLIDRLTQLMAAQQRFIADASHQLRTPVANIRTQVEIALRANSYDEVRAILGNIDMASNRLVRLTGQLLALSRLEIADTGWGRFDTFAIEEALFEAVAGLVPAALLKSIDIRVDASGETPMFYGDRDAIEHIVSNIVDNAVLYTPNEGRVFVQSWACDGVYYIVIEDTGPGLSEGDRDRVLERFNRGHNSSKKGTGLGLSIAREAARIHRGRLDLREAQLGGLRAEITLPIDYRTATH